MRKYVLALLGLAALQTASAFNDPTGIEFVKNQGQWPSNNLYMARIGGGWVWVDQGAFTFHFMNEEDVEKLHELHHGHLDASQYSGIRNHVFRMEFVGANTLINSLGEKESKVKRNYFLGNNPNQWKSGVPAFFNVQLQDVWSGVDVRLSTSQDGYLKYDYLADNLQAAASIKWKYNGISPVLNEGRLVFNSHAGEIIEMIPMAYQIINGEKVMIGAAYRMNANGEFTIDLNNVTQPLAPIVIDPTLIFSSFTGSTADNWGFTATYDNNGSLYSGGVAFGAGYPFITGSFDNSFGGGTVDAVISKFSPTGNTLLYSTYLGGSNSEAPHSMFVNANGELHVFGTTSSSNFPTTAGCYDNSYNGGPSVTVNGISYSSGSDIYVAKFNAAGGALLGSTFVGGTGNDGLNTAATLNFNYADQMRGEIIVDGSGNIYVASSTLSSNFPATAGAMQTTLSGTQDGCAFELNSSLSTLQWATYIGGTSTDAAYGLKLGSNGNLYVCGGTRSTNLPTTSGVINATSPGGSSDGYVMALNASNGAQIAGTYNGTNNYDQSYLIEIDDDDDVYLFGQTKGTYPVFNAPYSLANGKQFIHKMNNTLTTTIYSTSVGDQANSASDIDISPTAFLVDDCENVYLSGWGGSTNNEGSTDGLPVTTDAYDNTTDGSDFYFMVLERNMNSLIYGSFFGGTSAEHVDGGTSRFDPAGTIYQAVCAACGGGNTFPTTPGVWSTTNNSTNCNLGAIKMEFNYNGITADATAGPNVIACDPPYDVNFNGSTNAVNHFWDFGDGTGTSTQANPSYTFQDTGFFQIMYVAIDSSTCNIADTVYLTVDIDQSEVFSADFNIAPFDPCLDDTLLVDLAFTGSGADSLIWNMGDGTTYNDTVVNHAYVNQGVFIITLTAYDFTCNRVETFSDTVDFTGYAFSANANAAPNIITCDPPYDVSFSSGGTTAPNHYWDFGDGIGNSTQANPSYTYTDTGQFQVMYIATDSASCNISDTAYLSVTILQPEEFSAEFSSIPPQPCRDTVLVDVAFTGTGADSLVWNMGDGTTFTNDTSVFYFYVTPGTYTLSLTAWDFTCNKTETISQTIIVEEASLAGQVVIPNVFSPNGDGENDKFMPFFGNYPGVEVLSELDVYNIRIYNRWGKLLFEGADAAGAWDGKFDGKDAEEGVYFYIVEYQRKCWDTEATVSSGHVTLVR